MEEKKTILIIDDEEDIVKMLKLRFEQTYNVLTAYDGESGLQIANESKPHLIVLDINMPKMDGIEFYGRICGQDKKPRFPVLVLTARGELKDLFKQMDADGFMEKPFETDELSKEIEIIIAKRYEGAVRRKSKLAGAPKKVLIAEDNKDTFNKLAVAFLNAGYVVNSSNSGMNAVEKVLADVPDLLVIKLGLSDLSGDLVAVKLKQMPKTMDMAVVLYTQESDNLDHFVSEKISKHIGVKVIQSDDPYVLLDEARAVLKDKQE
ncbi:response regulator [Candidatus Omnitrophota bacterium]